MPAQAEGYSPAEQTFTVTNTGANPTGALAVSLVGEGASNFVLNTASISGIDPGDSASFTVKPIERLTVGSYAATVEVEDAAHERGIMQLAEITFTVEPLSISLSAGAADFIANRATADAQFTVGSNASPSIDAGNFRVAALDGSLLDIGTPAAPGADGFVENGSVKLTINKNRLNSLGTGSHDLIVVLQGGNYTDVNVTTYINVRTAPPTPAPSPDSDGRANPKTGAAVAR